MIKPAYRIYLAAFSAVALIVFIIIAYRAEIIPRSVADRIFPSRTSSIPSAAPIKEKTQTLALHTPMPQPAKDVVVHLERADRNQKTLPDKARYGR